MIASQVTISDCFPSTPSGAATTISPLNGNNGSNRSSIVACSSSSDGNEEGSGSGSGSSSSSSYRLYEAMFRVVKDSENVDERQHCFLIQTANQESR